MDKAKKKTVKRGLFWGAIALVTLLLALMPALAKNDAKTDGPTASILQGTVSTGTIRTDLHGGGTLESSDEEAITLPADVKIVRFLVKNGDTVTKGTPLAEADKVSLMTAITEIQDSMNTLQKQIEALGEETASTTISASAGGRVKEVYAQPGDSVQDVMLEHGSLAVLSLDGLMAVDIPTVTDLATGDAVLVTLADSGTVSGRVESSLNGTLVVTVEDEGYTAGQSAEVTREDGTSLGQGCLYIHSAWKATAYTGVISTVHAQVEREVSSGGTLFTLADTDFPAEKQLLSAKHETYREKLQELIQMYESGVITAPCDGLVSGIQEDSAHLLAAEESSAEIQLLNLDSEEAQGWKIVLLSNVESTAKCTGGENCLLDPDSPDHLPGCIGACDRSADCDATVHHKNCIKSCTHADNPEDCPATVHYSDCIKGCLSAREAGQCKSGKHTLQCIESCISSDGSTDCPALVHKPDCLEACTHEDTEGVCKAKKYHYADCIESCVSSDSPDTPCPASKHKEDCYYAGMTYKAKAAKVSSVGMELVVFWDASGTEYDVEKTGSGWTLSGGAQLNKDLLVSSGPTVSVSNPQQFSAGDIILVVTGYKNGDPVWSNVVLYEKGQQGGNIPGGGFPGFSGGFGGIGGLSGFGGMGGMPASDSGADDGLYDLEWDTLMTVTPQDTMTVTIAVDEKDISKVSLGQTAQITLTALKNEVYEGTVTKVAVSGTNSGGSSKFAVELTLPAEENMLAGMNASVTIPLSAKENVLTLPVAVLVEDKAETLVYTALDKNTGEPCDPVKVETGVSDGENVEILSGLQNGDTFYYSYYDTLELSTTASAGTSFR